MAKDPAFLFYPGDFSTGTQFFTDEQVGKYVRLLMAQHQHGHLTQDQVIHICKSYDNHIMLKFKKDSAGLWYNERLEIEIEKRKNYVLSRSRNKGGKTKQKIISSSYDLHMENENENVLNNKNSVPKNFGPETGEPYFIIDPETPGVKMFKVTKIEGLQEFYSENQSVISDRAMAEKFMRRRLGKKFKDFNHVWNDLNQFTEKQYA